MKKTETKAFLRIEWWPHRNPTLFGADVVSKQVSELKSLRELIEKSDPCSIDYIFSIGYDYEYSCLQCSHVVEPTEVLKCRGCGCEICDYCFYLSEDDTQELCAECFAKNQQSVLEEDDNG